MEAYRLCGSPPNLEYAFVPNAPCLPPYSGQPHAVRQTRGVGRQDESGFGNGGGIHRVHRNWSGFS